MTIPTQTPFADRINSIPESFIREILKVSSKPDMISFAGGLPNPKFFPVEKIAAAVEKVLSRDGAAALQYWVTEGYLPLRDYIAQWQSKKMDKPIKAEDILMLNGSQQGLDLVGKLFINTSSQVLLEGPSYLGAIQAFSAYQPTFNHIKIHDGGPDIDEFNRMVKKIKPVMFYCVPNFQNPTGNTYDFLRREKLAAHHYDTDMIWIEDNPYSEISFDQKDLPDFYSLIPRKTIMLGSFSKIISPGMRLGWAMGPSEVMKKMTVVKQGSDLHSNNLAQRIVYQFLVDNPLDDHLKSIRKFYKSQADLMIGAIRSYFPKQTTWIDPKGGMFVWVTLPENIDARTLLLEAIKQNVIFVPGENFYVGEEGHGKNSMRMNFSNPSQAEIMKGIKILGKLIHDMDS
jgi:2-aminoadipate transaminase